MVTRIITRIAQLELFCGTLVAGNQSESLKVHADWDSPNIMQVVDRLRLQQQSLTSLVQSQISSTEYLKSQVSAHHTLLLAQSSAIKSQRHVIDTMRQDLDNAVAKVLGLENAIFTDKGHVHHQNLTGPWSVSSDYWKELRTGNFRQLPGVTPSALSSETVAFSVRKPTSSPDAGEKIVFELININDGHSYDINTGYFTCPFSGTYVFYHSLLVNDSHLAAAGIVVNGEANEHTYAQGDTHSYGTGSTLSIFHLNQGDRVWVQVFVMQPGAKITYAATSFAGFKIN